LAVFQSKLGYLGVDLRREMPKKEEEDLTGFATYQDTP